MRKAILSMAISYTFFLPLQLQASEQSLAPKTYVNDFKDLYYVYTVNIQNKDYRFILNSGSSASAIDEKLAKELASPLKQQDYPAYIKNLLSLYDTPPSLSFIKAPEIKIGANPVYLDVLAVQDLSKVESYTGFHVDGVIGMDMINQYIWEIDNKNKKVYLHDFSNRQVENNYSSCVIYDVQNYGLPVLTLKKDDQFIPFILKTGANTSEIHQAYVINLRMREIEVYKENKLTDPQSGKEQNNEDYYLDEFSFAGQTVKNDRFISGDVNYLGLRFLQRFDQFLLNPVNHTFCFNGFSKKGINKIYRSIGAIAHAGAIELAGNNAEWMKKKGLNNGDVIVSINAVKYSPEQIDRVRQLLAETKTVKLEIKRDDKIITVTLTD